MYVQSNTAVLFIPLVAISFGHFDHHQVKTTQNLKVWLHVRKFQVIYLRQCQYLLKILSFVACDMIYYGFYWQRTV